MKAANRRVRTAMTVASHNKNGTMQASTAPLVGNFLAFKESIINPGFFKRWPSHSPDWAIVVIPGNGGQGTCLCQGYGTAG